MAQVDLSVEIRPESGKGFARRLRAAGQLPAVVYGKEVNPPQPVSVDPKVLGKIVEQEGWNVLLKLTGDNDLNGKIVMIKDASIDPLSRDMISADFHAINLTQVGEFTIPVHLVGDPVGEEEGGSLDLIRKELTVRCLPSVVPNEIVIDVSALDIGDTIHIEDVVAPDGVEMVYEVNFTVVTVSYIKEEVEEDLEEETVELDEDGEAVEEAETDETSEEDED